MSDRDQKNYPAPDGLDPRLKKIEELAGSLPDEKPAREEFSARLRSQFASGTIPAGPYVADVEMPSPRGRVIPGPWRFVVVAAAVAAVFLIVSALNRGPGFDQITGTGSGSILIEGESFPVLDSDQYADLLKPGTRFEIEGDMSTLLDLVYPGFMAVQVTPGVQMTVPKPAGRWFGRRASFGVEHGEVRVVTGPDFAGAGLEIAAPGTEIDILGTTFAVICSPCSTCVCVLDGIAQMTGKNGLPVSVSPGRRNTFFNDVDRPPLNEPIRGDERMKLEMLRAAALPQLEKKPGSR